MTSNGPNTALDGAARGSVLVVGGGIGGMQAALDLAGSGFYVHMVTDESSIGGKMARLDKTFPTNDCAMCLLGPRMTDCQNHPNIEIKTMSTVTELSGSPGRFAATVRSEPRYIDVEECTSCGECDAVCPVQIKDSFNLGLSNRRAIGKLFPQAVPNAYFIHKRGQAPCKYNCPIDCNSQAFVALLSQGKFVEALEVIRRTVPFPGILGRVCEHRCETNCNRLDNGGSVSVALLKRAADDFGREDRERALAAGEEAYSEERPERAEAREERVAVIGAGPAGLVAARDLYLAGFSVTLYESLPMAGGILRAGIPRYRLPADIVDREVEPMLEGIDFRPNTRVGVDVSWDEIRSNHNAVVIAVGLAQSRRLPLDGSDSRDVLYGLSFLQDVALEKKPAVGKRVLVIGGGCVAMDAARSSLRLGADQATIICVEDRHEMAAHDWEVDEALGDEVAIHTHVGPKRIITDSEGRVTGVEIRRVSSAFDPDGRFNPRYIEGSEEIWPADTVVLCVGQAPDTEFIDDEVEKRSGGIVVSDPVTRETSVPGVFAAGDICGEPASVVAAIAGARQAVESVRRYLDGIDLREGREPGPDEPYLDAPDMTVSRDGERGHERRLTLVDNSNLGFEECNLGFTREEAIAEAERCLNCGICSECLQCEFVCEKDAVHHDAVEQVSEIEVGAVVLAPGFGLYDATHAGEYGYGRYQNVLTSYEFERLLSSTGPTGGHVERPSDGRAPKKVAFIQCVGSRDGSCDAEYCSSICCLYATKEAVVAREHDPGIEPKIFFLDIRAFGKGFDRYVDTARDGYGVEYVRTMISSVKEDPVTGDLKIKYFVDGELTEETFDLVVLATGVRPPEGAADLARITGIDLNEHGFARTSDFSPVATSRPGVFVAGGFRGPQDIPETVMSASAAAAEAMELLAPVRGTEVRIKEYPVERDVTDEEPRVGVFICRCGINIASVVDVERVLEHARTIPGVAFAQETLYTCSQDSLKNIREMIEEHNLNRVVVASCTIRTHQTLFRETLREAGLNQFLFDMANIRDQCSWVHKNDVDGATAKAIDLVEMSVAKVKLHRSLELLPVPVTQKGLVVGGGVAGMTAALSLAAQGFDVALVEREPELGGNLRRIERTLSGADVQGLLRSLVERITDHPRIETYTGVEIDEFGGHCGKFNTIVRREDGTTDEIEHGTVIVATGGGEWTPDLYRYGEDPRILTGLEFEARLHEDSESIKSVNEIAFIQCVGSRCEERNYCSRTCCAETIKNALLVKKINPDARIYVLYRDIRAYGFMEAEYRAARDAGITFILYEPESEPELSIGERWLELSLHDRASNRDLVLKPDLLVLAAATVPAAGTPELANMLKVPTTEDGFFLETHIKLGPMDFPSQGIFLCGAAHGPKFISESSYQARGAAARAASILSKEQLFVGGTVAVVDPDRCAACLTCVRVCPYNVPTIDRETQAAVIEAVQCQGCGTCASDCPGRAIQLGLYEDDQVAAKLTGLFRLRAAGD